LRTAAKRVVKKTTGIKTVGVKTAGGDFNSAALDVKQKNVF